MDRPALPGGPEESGGGGELTVVGVDERVVVEPECPVGSHVETSVPNPKLACAIPERPAGLLDQCQCVRTRPAGHLELL